MREERTRTVYWKILRDIRKALSAHPFFGFSGCATVLDRPQNIVTLFYSFFARLGVISPNYLFRAMVCSRRENDLSIELLKNGLTLMGIRVYETLLMEKYLQHLAVVDSRRIGLLGHSGGNSVAPTSRPGYRTPWQPK